MIVSIALAVLVAMIVARNVVEQVEKRRHRPTVDPTADIMAALLARLHEAVNERIEDVQDHSDAHLNALTDLSNAWAERYCTQLDANLEAHRETIRQWADDLRHRRLDDVRALIAQTPSATNYAVMDRTAQVREPGDVGARAADVEEARLRPWLDRRHRGQAMDELDGTGRPPESELRDPYGDPIIPVGAGG